MSEMMGPGGLSPPWPLLWEAGLMGSRRDVPQCSALPDSRTHGNGNTGRCTPKFIPALTTEPLWFLAKLQAVPRTQISTLWWSQPRSCCSRAPVAALCAQGSTFNPYNSALFPALPELQTLPHIPLECCKSLLVPLDEPHPGEASPPCIPRWHLGL